MSDFGDVLKDAAVTAVGAATGALVKDFLDKHPTVEEQVATGKDMLEQALALFPEGKLHEYLRDDDARDAILGYRLMKAFALGALGQKP